MAHSSTSWERLADKPGGDVAGLATASTDGGSIVFAATAVGVYQSTDGGRTWTLAAIGASVPFAEVVAPSPRFGQDRTIFVCAADGLYRSTDAGESWVPVLVGSRMFSIATASDAADGVVVLAGTDTDGVLRSADAGRTWTGANAGLVDLTVMALALSPAFASDRTGFAGTASGLYRTRNGARSWREVDTGLEDPAVQCLAVSPTFANDGLVLAGTEAHGLLRSVDGGATWDIPQSLAGRSITALAFGAPPLNADRPIAAATDAGVAVSHDAGETWHIQNREPAEVLSLLCVAQDGGEMLFAGLHRDGVVRSADAGATWTAASDGLHARLRVGLALSPAIDQDQTLFIAALLDGVSVSHDGGHSWADSPGWPQETAALGMAISPDYLHDQTLLAATPNGIQISRDAGLSWQLVSGTAGQVRAVVCARADGAPVTVLAALSDGRLPISDDGAATWRTETTRFGDAEIIGLAVSPSYARDRTIFIATTSAYEVAVWRSTSGGQRWHQWLVEAGRSDTLPLAISPNFAVDELVFIGHAGQVRTPLRHAREVRAGKRRPVWRGTRLGDGSLAITALAISPSFAVDETVFAATNSGVFVSRNGGDTFDAWSEGLEPPRMVALAISPNYADDRLVFGLGLGGLVWRRRDQT
jgi:photosystem II stability/assembly factor-like uncharacterized protein